MASLVENGFAATTTVEVQCRAGLSRDAFLHHFPTRQEMFTAAVRRLVEVNLGSAFGTRPTGVDGGAITERAAPVIGS